MKSCSLENSCLSHVCSECDVAQKLAEAELPPQTHINAKLTDEQFDRLLRNNSMRFIKSYHLFPDDGFVWLCISIAVVFCVGIIYG